MSAIPSEIVGCLVELKGILSIFGPLFSTMFFVGNDIEDLLQLIDRCYLLSLESLLIERAPFLWPFSF